MGRMPDDDPMPGIDLAPLLTRVRRWLCRHGYHAWRDAYVFFDQFANTPHTRPAALVGQTCVRCPARRHVAMPRRYRVPAPGSHTYSRARVWTSMGDRP